MKLQTSNKEKVFSNLLATDLKKDIDNKVKLKDINGAVESVKAFLNNYLQNGASNMYEFSILRESLNYIRELIQYKEPLLNIGVNSDIKTRDDILIYNIDSYDFNGLLNTLKGKTRDEITSILMSLLYSNKLRNVGFHFVKKNILSFDIYTRDMSCLSVEMNIKKTNAKLRYKLNGCWIDSCIEDVDTSLPVNGQNIYAMSIISRIYDNWDFFYDWIYKFNGDFNRLYKSYTRTCAFNTLDSYWVKIPWEILFNKQDSKYIQYILSIANKERNYTSKYLKTIFFHLVDKDLRTTETNLNVQFDYLLSDSNIKELSLILENNYKVINDLFEILYLGNDTKLSYLHPVLRTLANKLLSSKRVV